MNASNAPGLAVNVNPATNQLYGDTYDANGNDTSFGIYDVENRLITANGGSYGYAPDGKRVYKQPASGPAEYYFWGPNGQRLGTYTSTNPQSNGYTTASTNVYFGGRLLQAGGNTILVDRLGSNVSNGKRYYPYGMEKPSATANEVEKFTGYFRDAETGLDYAQSRYYEPGYARFITPDPNPLSSAAYPGGWNAYAYSGGDPVNARDPSGLDWIYTADGGWCSTLDPDGGCYDPGYDSSIGDCAALYQVAWMNPVGYEMMCGIPGAPMAGSSPVGSGGVPSPGGAAASTLPDPILPSADADFLNTLVSEGFATGYSYDGQNVTLYTTGTFDGWVGTVYADELCGAFPQACAEAGAIMISLGTLTAALAAGVAIATLPTPAHPTTASQSLGAILKGRQGNVKDTGVVQQLQQNYPSSANPCVGLAEMLAAAKKAGDTQEVQKIVATMKAFGCRNVRKTR